MLKLSEQMYEYISMWLGCQNCQSRCMDTLACSWDAKQSTNTQTNYWNKNVRMSMAKLSHVPLVCDHMSRKKLQGETELLYGNVHWTDCTAQHPTTKTKSYIAYIVNLQNHSLMITHIIMKQMYNNNNNQDLLQSPHCEANCLQHLRSNGPEWDSNPHNSIGGRLGKQTC